MIRWKWLTVISECRSMLRSEGSKLCTLSLDKKYVDKAGLPIARRSYCSYYLLDTYL